MPQHMTYGEKEIVWYEHQRPDYVYGEVINWYNPPEEWLMDLDGFPCRTRWKMIYD